MKKLYEKYLDWRLKDINSEIEITENYLEFCIVNDAVLPTYSFNRKLIDLEKLKSKKIN